MREKVRKTGGGGTSREGREREVIDFKQERKGGRKVVRKEKTLMSERAFTSCTVFTRYGDVRARCW